MTYRLTWNAERGRFRSNGEASFGDTEMTQEEAWEIIRQNNGNIFDAIKDKQCKEAAARASAGLDAYVADLSRNWMPTGFYTNADLEKVLNATFSVLQSAGNALDAMNPPTEASRSLRGAITSRYGEALPYVQAMNEAKAKGIRVVDAPGVKRWVIKAMNEAALAHEHVAYVACHAHWAVTLGVTLMTVTMAAAGVIRTVVGVSWEVIKTTGELALKVPDLVGDLYTYGSWALVLGAGWWLWNQRKKT